MAMSTIERIETVYLCGPMRGYPEYNFPAFDEAEMALIDYGYVVVSPAAHDRDMGFDPTDPASFGPFGSFDLKESLLWDLEQVHAADLVFVLPGWEQSRGCRAEVAAALSADIPVFEYETKRKIVNLRFVATYSGSGIDYVAMAPEMIHHTADKSCCTLYNQDEHVVTDPVTGGSKGAKLARFDLLPWDVVYELAEHYGKGCKKYDDRNWEKGYDWGLSAAALARHFAQWMSGEDYDEETGSSHLIAVAWHALALRWFQKHNRGKDDRSI